MIANLKLVYWLSKTEYPIVVAKQKEIVVVWQMKEEKQVSTNYHLAWYKAGYYDLHLQNLYQLDVYGQ